MGRGVVNNYKVLGNSEIKQINLVVEKLDIAELRILLNQSGMIVKQAFSRIFVDHPKSHFLDVKPSKICPWNFEFPESFILFSCLLYLPYDICLQV